ncbi:hypothetical protein LJC64_01255 [Ruminococcaceae bacterium OttesenSCG-928-A11]|nr:hypothetical protein [Ruminococcaceae bacterium OttesenSCG-928-A11]
MEESYIRWKTGDFPEDEYSLVKFIHETERDTNRTVFFLENVPATYEIAVSTDGDILALSVCSELSRMHTIIAAQRNSGQKTLFRNWPLYEVINSKYTEWVARESCLVYEPHDLKHYAIITTDVVIDIVDTGIPRVSVRRIDIH